ncbi:MAG: Tat (twin-arginine translocation) pathway signal sequence domain protein, partial [Polyangiales bacterium]
AERWFATQFASLLDKLASTPEADGSGSLLDTSTVIWVKELGDSRLHDFKAVPFVIAGSGNGYWKPGRYLKLDSVPHQKLLVSLCLAMGVDVDHFGVSDITGDLPELSG